jgi:predicted DNA-binding protein (MmcQ/YjbR family)
MSLKSPTPPGTRTRATAAETRLRKVALSLPEVREDHPWGHSAFKVGKKAFLFMASENGGLSLSVKLPQSGLLALSLPFAQPTGYGLGKSGWVTASFIAKQSPPLSVLERWVEESYRAIAPKKVLARLDNPAGPAGPARKGKGRGGT